MLGKAKRSHYAIRARSELYLCYFHLDKSTKDYVKVIKCVKSPKSGAYSFKEAIINKEQAKDFFQEEK